MKTKQEQIEEIKQVLIKTCKRCRSFEEDYMQSKYAESLYNAGYRKAEEIRKETAKEIEQFKTSNQNAIDKINELQKEINALQEENRRLDEYVSCTLSAQEFDEEIKQAQIEVLNRLKSLSIYDDNYLDGYVFIDDIEKLLEELKK